MLQVIISPAKQMRAAQDAFEVLSIPPFVRETARLHRALLDIERNEGSGGLQALWNVSDKLLGPCLNTLHEFGPILKSGDLDEVSAVIKALMHRDSTRGLSNGERKMLHIAKQILVSEIVLAEDVEYPEAEGRVNAAMLLKESD